MPGSLTHQPEPKRNSSQFSGPQFLWTRADASSALPPVVERPEAAQAATQAFKATEQEP